MGIRNLTVKAFRLLVKLVLRPSYTKLQLEIDELQEQLRNRVVFYEISEEHIREGLEGRQPISLRRGNDIVKEIIKEVHQEWVEWQNSTWTLIKASLLPQEDYQAFLQRLIQAESAIFESVGAIMRIKLLNAMAERDFEATFGMTREEWEKQRPKDEMDELVAAIRDKKELPADVKEALKEVDGFVPWNWDYSDKVN